MKFYVLHYCRHGKLYLVINLYCGFIIVLLFIESSVDRRISYKLKNILECLYYTFYYVFSYCSILGKDLPI